jgi:hypothetical protein
MMGRRSGKQRAHKTARSRKSEATFMQVRPRRMTLLTLAGVVLLTACRERPQPAAPLPEAAGAVPAAPGPQAMTMGIGGASESSDADKVRDADDSILFVGNSHTAMHDLPSLVARMIAFRHPEKKVYTHFLWVSFLEDTAGASKCKQEIETRPWKHVVLQAQKISASGRFDYSKQEGIDIATLAKAQGASVCFFSEWGLRGVADSGPRHEKIYTEMARAAGANVAPVGRAWDLVLADRPGLELHAPDGNHQSPIGAFLTGCVLFGRLTGESPRGLAPFAHADVDEDDRRLLADAAATALAAGAPAPD